MKRRPAPKSPAERLQITLEGARNALALAEAELAARNPGSVAIGVYQLRIQRLKTEIADGEKRLQALNPPEDKNP